AGSTSVSPISSKQTSTGHCSPMLGCGKANGQDGRFKACGVKRHTGIETGENGPSIAQGNLNGSTLRQRTSCSTMQGDSVRWRLPPSLPSSREWKRHIQAVSSAYALFKRMLVVLP